MTRDPPRVARGGTARTARVRSRSGEPLPFERLDDFVATEAAFKEAMRLTPPVPSILRGRHKFAFRPVRGGGHMCLGLKFSHMQTKCFAWHFFNGFRVSVAKDYRPSWSMWPIPYPRDSLKVTLDAV
jgi:cytochrome P450